MQAVWNFNSNLWNDYYKKAIHLAFSWVETSPFRIPIFDLLPFNDTKMIPSIEKSLWLVTIVTNSLTRPQNGSRDTVSWDLICLRRIQYLSLTQYNDIFMCLCYFSSQKFHPLASFWWPLISNRGMQFALRTSSHDDSMVANIFFDPNDSYTSSPYFKVFYVHSVNLLAKILTIFTQFDWLKNTKTNSFFSILVLYWYCSA